MVNGSAISIISLTALTPSFLFFLTQLGEICRVARFMMLEIMHGTQPQHIPSRGLPYKSYVAYALQISKRLSYTSMPIFSLIRLILLSSLSLLLWISVSANTPYRKEVIEGLLGWVRLHTAGDKGGVFISSKRRIPYDEVTGYYIPTLIAIGEPTLAEQYGSYLLDAQLPDGSYGLPGTSFAFDTGMVVRGFIALNSRLPQESLLKQRLHLGLSKACNWLTNHIDSKTGRFIIPKDQWGLYDRGFVSEGIHLLILKPLLDCGAILQDDNIINAAQNMKSNFLRPSTVKELGLTNFEQRHMLTHFYAYIQEALVELGYLELAKQGMASVAKFQSSDGSVPAYSDVSWICTTGLAQLSMVWYRIGDTERADKSLKKVLALQNRGTAGFFGSTGANAAYFPDEEISWAVKYTLDALVEVPRARFDATVQMFPTELKLYDGRLASVTAQLHKHVQRNVAKIQTTNKIESFIRVLDVGAGKGRFATSIKKLFKSKVDLFATDISKAMLDHVPKSIKAQVAPITALPYPNNFFDVIYTIEVLEHVVLLDAAVNEIKRVLKPEGTLVIVDKNADDPRSKLWTLDPWERWFTKDGILKLLTAHGFKKDGLKVFPVGYEHVIVPDGLFFAWVAHGYHDQVQKTSNTYAESDEKCRNMSMKKVVVIVGTRPEAIKIAPVVRELHKYYRCLTVRVWATGQHNELFAQAIQAVELSVDVNLHTMKAGQNLMELHASLLQRLAEQIKKETGQIDMVIVQGDTMSTLAGAEAAFYSNIPVAHVEAGLRSHNNLSPFPEEMNRRTISLLATLHFAVSEESVNNLALENINDNVHIVGNTVIDQLRATIIKPINPQVANALKEIFRYPGATYILTTVHRRENHGGNVQVICDGILALTKMYPNVHFIFIMHPNPGAQEPVINRLNGEPSVTLVIPLPYITLAHILARVDLVFTDSGGLQEESVALGKPVFVLRDSTDRPEGNPVVLQHFQVDRFIGMAKSLIEATIIKQRQIQGKTGSTPLICSIQNVSEEFAKCGQTAYGNGTASTKIAGLLMDSLWLKHEEGNTRLYK